MRLYLIIAILLLIIYSILSTQSCNRWKENYIELSNMPADTVKIAGSVEGVPDTFWRDTGTVKYYPVFKNKIKYKDSLIFKESTDTILVPLFLNTYTKKFSDTNIDINIKAKVFGELDSIFIDYKYNKIIPNIVTKDGIYLGGGLLFTDKVYYGGQIELLRNKWAIEAGYFHNSDFTSSFKTLTLKHKIWSIK